MGGEKLRQKLLCYNTPRRIIQLVSFVFFSTIVFNFGVLPFLFPVLWTWGAKLNTAGDAFTAIQLMLSGWKTALVFPWLAVASFLIVGVLIGKSLCGWICPFGFIQDLVGFIKRKQTDLSQRDHDTLIYAKYVILGITLFISVTFSASRIMGLSEGYSKALGIFSDAPFTTLSPSETLFGTLPRMIQDSRLAILGGKPAADLVFGITNLSPLFWAQFAVMIGVLVFVAYVPRSWCRYFCPHGAIMAIMNRFSFIGLRREPFKCEKGGCRACVQACPTRVAILELPWEKFSDPECIYCMKCADACPHKAIKLRYP